MHRHLLLALVLPLIIASSAAAAEPDATAWKYSPGSLRPFWLGETLKDEPILFIKDPASGIARGKVLFSIKRVLSVRNGENTIAYREGRDFTWNAKSREIVLPPDSRIVSRTVADLRRPDGSQRHRLTHRDGNGEILFGAKLEYHQMQTCITYTRLLTDCPSPVSAFNEKALPRSIATLRAGKPFSIVVLGDSISTGCNASGWGGGAPHQPAYPELLKLHLEAVYRTTVSLTNLSVGGKASHWGISMVDQVAAAKPDLVIVAFGMNDSARVPATEFKTNISAIIGKTREQVPEAEFILVASMLGNRNWTYLKHELFEPYRDALNQLVKPGIAVADLTTVWTEFLRLKDYLDLTGNGVNHPNDFGHRVYAQVIAALLAETD